jgi:hypothetical protein
MIALVALLFVTTGCSSGERPDTATWLRSWQSINAVIPDQSDLGNPPQESLCQTTLGTIRERSEELFPTPSGTVDDLVNEWVAIAQAAFFECPPEGEDIDSFDDAYREMLRVEDSVTSALAD